jgi:hypothetical protein
MRMKLVLLCVLLCLAVFGPSRPVLAGSSDSIPEDLLDHLLLQGWTQVSPGVMQRSLGGNRVETLGFGADGLRFQLRELRAYLVELRKDYAQHPSRQLQMAIRAYRAQILRIEGALRKTKSADELELAAEGLIEGCANYDAAAIAYPLAQGTASKAAAYFNNACGYLGDVFAHSMSKATAADNSVTIITLSDPPSGTPRKGTNVSAGASTSVNGVSDCESYAYASVDASSSLGIVYAQSDWNRSCVASLPFPWAKADVGTVGLAGDASHDNDVFRLIAGGTDLAGAADAFHFVHRTLTGDGTIVANVAALLKPVGATRTLAGVTFRNDLTAGSAHATMTISSEGEAQFRRRATAGGTTVSTAAAMTFAPQWLKLVRSGNAFSAYLSADGFTWTQVSTPQTVSMSNTVSVGLVALRNGSGTPTGGAKFENVTVTPLTVPAHNYFAVNPCRLLDTRSTTILTNNQPRVVNIAGLCGIPSTAKAVSLNVTAVSPTDSGKIALYPGDFPTSWSGAVSSINFAPATSPRANNAVIQLATNGAGTLGINAQVAGSPGQVHLLLDVEGYFSTDTAPASGAQGPLGFQTLTLCRIADTRWSSTPLVSGPARNFTAQGVCGIPAGAAVASLHIGVPAPAYVAHIALFPSNISYPGTSTINFSSATTHPHNGVRVKLAPTTPDFAAIFGTVTPGASAHAYFDVNGYFKSDAPLKYRPVTPCRVVDTADPAQGGALVTDTVRTFQVRGKCGVPAGAKAVIVRLVVSGPTSAGKLSVYPSGQSLPVNSTVRFDANEPGLSFGTTVPLSTLTQDLAVSPGEMTAGGTVHLAIDVFGYFQ